MKELRLAALRDPVAHLAFLESYEEAVAKSDAYWRERTAGASEGATARQQLIAEGPDGTWGGSVTVLVEDAGTQDPFGGLVEQNQAHLVGVFVRPGQRGRGVTEALFEAAIAWSWEIADVERVRLFVHERNARAEAFYRKVGFLPTGVTVPVPGEPGALEVEFAVKRP